VYTVHSHYGAQVVPESATATLGFCFFFFELGFWTPQGLTLARQVLYHLSHSTSPLLVGSHKLFVWADSESQSSWALPPDHIDYKREPTRALHLGLSSIWPQCPCDMLQSPYLKYYLLIFSSVGYVVMSPIIPDIGNLYFLHFYLISLATSVPILVIFSDNYLLGSRFLLLFLCFLFHWFLLFIISFLLHGLGLISSFSVKAQA
jgi:hypothetical protein